MADSSQVKELTSKLEKGVQDLFNTDTYAEYLKTMSRFHKYSTRNTLLIHLQYPNASLVAGYQSWQTKFERHVKQGEKSIKILAPVPFTKREEKEKIDPDTRQPIIGEDGMPVVEVTEQRLIAKFNIVNVYDVNQTDGKPLPTLVQDLTGNVEQYEAFMDALRDVSPLPIVFEPMEEGKDGYCRFGEKIAIREGMSEIQTLCAAIHEITHSKLHDIESLRLQDPEAKPKDRRTEEVEAESVSYAVNQFFGIETGANSFGYVAEWSRGRELKELNASLDTIRKMAAELIDAIDGKFQEIVKERNISFAIAEQQDELAAPEIPLVDAINNNIIDGVMNNEPIKFEEIPMNDRALIANIQGYIQSYGRVMDITDNKIYQTVLRMREEEKSGDYRDVATYMLNERTRIEFGRKITEISEPAPQTQTLEQAEPQSDKSTERPITALQQKALDYAKSHAYLPLQSRLDIIAKAFNCNTATIERQPCTGKWRGHTDVSIRFDNGAALYIGTKRTPETKKQSVIDEFVNDTLAYYNPYIIAETKALAAAALLKRETEDNAIAEKLGLLPYKFLNVELNDGSVDGYIGWYSVTLAVNGKIISQLETGLNYDIAGGKVSEHSKDVKYFVAGGLKDTDADFVFNGVGFSSTKDSYRLVLSEDVMKRALDTLEKRNGKEETDKMTGESTNLTPDDKEFWGGKIADFLATNDGKMELNDLELPLTGNHGGLGKFFEVFGEYSYEKEFANIVAQENTKRTGEPWVVFKFCEGGEYRPEFLRTPTAMLFAEADKFIREYEPKVREIYYDGGYDKLDFTIYFKRTDNEVCSINDRYDIGDSKKVSGFYNVLKAETDFYYSHPEIYGWKNTDENFSKDKELTYMDISILKNAVTAEYPYVEIEKIIRYADGDRLDQKVFNKGEILSFAEADSKIKIEEKAIREKNMKEYGRPGDGDEELSIAVHFNMPGENEPSVFRFSYLLGDYEEERSGLLKHFEMGTDYYNRCIKEGNYGSVNTFLDGETKDDAIRLASEYTMIYETLCAANKQPRTESKMNETSEKLLESEKAEKQYELGYGFLGNGVTIWNRAEERNNNYVTVAQIYPNRTVTFYDKDMPDDVKASIENAARTIQDPVLLPLEKPSVPIHLDMKQAQNKSDMPSKIVFNIPSPDPTINIAEMNKYGYIQDDMHPLSETKALELFDSYNTIYLLHSDNTDSMPDNRNDIIAFIKNGGLCGIANSDWEDAFISDLNKPKTAIIENNCENETVNLSQKDESDFDSESEIMPDHAIGFSEMNLYGYAGDDMLPLTNERAVELFDADLCIYLLYPDNTEGMALDRDEILNHSGLCGIESADWECSPVRAAQLAVAANAEGSRESELLYGDENKFGIYKIRDSIDEARNFQFAPMRELEALGLPVDRANYELVYIGNLDIRDTQTNLHKIFKEFNDDECPADYTGSSVSVSDVIVLQWRGSISSHFVDSVGFVKLDAFLGEEKQSTPVAETLSQVGTRLDEYKGATHGF